MSKKQPGNAGHQVNVTSTAGGLTVQTSGMSLVGTVSYNVEQDLILVTEDKVKLCLQRHVNTLGQQTAWLVPFGILVTIVTTLVTSTFKDVGRMKGDQFQAAYFVGAVACFVWMAVKLPAAFKRVSVDSLVVEIKAGSVKQNQPAAAQPTPPTAGLSAPATTSATP